MIVPEKMAWGYLHFGLAPLQLGQTHRLMFMQIPGALVRQFRFMQFGNSLQVGPLRHAEVRTVEQGQQGIFLHVLPDIHMDLHHPAPDERGDLSQFVFVGLHGGRKLPRYLQLSTGNRRDFDDRSREFFGGEMEHSRPVSRNDLVGPRHWVGRSLAGNKSSEHKGDEENNPASFVKRET
ncbi:MAG: hypothetical protein K8R65_02155 [Nitrospirae bacterium]|nr:hypothetical protein [Nitrospirota bacterium]